MILNPISQEGTKDVFSENLNHRIIHLTGEINDDMAASIVAQLAALEYSGSDSINIYINSPGGSVSAGLAIFDMIQTMKRREINIRTICIGRAASMAAIILSGGSERIIMPHAEVMIHQPSGGMEGKATDIMIAAEHMKDIKQVLNKILSDNCGKDINEVAKDTELDHWMNANEAVDYRIVDYIDGEQTGDGIRR